MVCLRCIRSVSRCGFSALIGKNFSIWMMEGSTFYSPTSTLFMTKGLTESTLVTFRTFRFSSKLHTFWWKYLCQEYCEILCVHNNNDRWYIFHNAFFTASCWGWCLVPVGVLLMADFIRFSLQLIIINFNYSDFKQIHYHINGVIFGVL